MSSNSTLPLDSYRFTPTRFDESISDISAQLLTAVDLGNNYCLATAEEILSMSMDDVMAALNPSPDLCPCVRIRGGVEEYPITSTMFLRSDGEFRLSLYFIFYGRSSTFEQQRRRLIDTCLRTLEQPDAGSSLGIDRAGSSTWMFKISPWTCTVDHDTPLRYFDRNIQLSTDYYCSRADITIQINEIGA